VRIAPIRSRTFRGALLFAGLLFAALLGGCQALEPNSAAGATNLCLPVLSNGAAYNSYRNSALTCLDPATGQVTGRYFLPPERAADAAPDAEGHIWIGLGGTDQRNGNQVVVMAADGQLVTALPTCSNPAAVATSGKAAFVVCAGDGYAGAVDRFDARTLRRTHTANLALPDAPYLLVAAAAGAEHLVITGMTRGPDSEVRFTVISVLDPVTLDLQWQSPPLRATDVWDILPYGDDFLLLNAASAEDRDAGDVLRLHPADGFRLEPLKVGAAPLWGALDGDRLYLYHNAAWNSISGAIQRQVTMYTVPGGAVQAVSLPDQWNAQDIALLQGDVLLSHWSPEGGTQDGLYRLDLTTGQLTQQLPILEAGTMSW
jgi:hypothetical protein